MYTIKQAAAMTGLPPDTIRAWERRYRLPSPQRSEGGYRLYDDAALEIYQAMRDLVAHGWRPHQAAQHALAARHLGQPAPTPEDFVAAVGEGQLAGADIATVLRTAFRAAPVAEVLDDWLVPTTRELGRAWAEGRVTITQEHEIAAGLMQRLAVLFADAESDEAGPLALIGLMPGCRHEVVMFGFAVLSRLARLDVCYLGADVPVASWVAECVARRPAAVVTAVHDDEDEIAARDLAVALPPAAPGTRLFVGGCRQEGLDDGAVQLGHRLSAGVERLVAALAPEPSGTDAS